MNKWAFALAACVVVGVGCAGGGGGSSTNGGNGGNTGESNAFVTLPNTPGILENVYLTGQGRAFGDLIAVIRRVEEHDTNGGSVETLLDPQRHLQLNGYTAQISLVNVPTTISRLFTQYNLEVQELWVDNGDGTHQTFSGGSQPLVGGQAGDFDAYYRILPGRETAVTVRLDDSMFNFDNNANTYVFDRDQFILTNYSQFGNEPSRMNGFLSDYAMFDLSHLTGGLGGTLPPFPDASGDANVLFINGDNFALGTLPDGPPDNSTADPKPFFVLTPVGYLEGSHVGPRTAINPENGQTTLIPGTYNVVQPDPRPPFDPASRITALQGTYKGFTHTLNSLGSDPNGFEIVAFPSTYTDDSTAGDYALMDIVLFNYVNGQITRMYFGQINLVDMTISAFPVAQITDPQDVSNEITGTITNMLDAGGSQTADISRVRQGHFTLNPANLPSSFTTTGRFIVYRR